jgi:hypothetical protein
VEILNILDDHSRVCIASVARRVSIGIQVWASFAAAFDLAMITTWRWDLGDQLPNGRQLGTEWLSQIRAALERKGLNIHG